MVSIILTRVLKILASLVPRVSRRGWRAPELQLSDLTRLSSSDFRSVRVLGAFRARLGCWMSRYVSVIRSQALRSPLGPTWYYLVRPDCRYFPDDEVQMVQ